MASARGLRLALANGRKAVMPGALIKSIGGKEQPPAGAVRDLPYDPKQLAVLREGRTG
jgi:hypothetical protein